MTESGRLRLTINYDDDGTAELIATASAHGFAGCGSAWFNISRIREFARGISRYPLGDEVVISGGYYSNTARGELAVTHLSIRVYIVSGRGQLGLRLLLSDPDFTRPHSVELEILTTYNRLERFSLDLIAMLNGTKKEAVIDEELL